MANVESAEPAHKVGRPRDESVRLRAIAAAIDCYAELGWSGFNFDVVATRAGVGRPALYRRWNDRAELLIDAFRETTAPMPDTDRGSLREDLGVIAEYYIELMRGARGKAGTRLFLEREEAAEVADVVLRDITAPRDQVIFGVLERAKERGEIDDRHSPAVVRTLLLGALVLVDLFPDPHGAAARPPAAYVDALLEGIASNQS